MVTRFRWPRIRSIVLTILCFLFAAAVAFQYFSYHNTAKMVSVPFEEQQINEKLLVYLFLSNMQEESNRFYEPYYTIAPTTAYYFTTVKDVRENGASVSVTFTNFPYLGSHDTIGEDEVTFSIDHSGEITDTQFRHLKNYDLPANLSHLRKGALPLISE